MVTIKFEHFFHNVYSALMPPPKNMGDWEVMACACNAPAQGALASVWKAQYEEIIPRHLGQLQQQLDASATGWLAGTQGPSIADFFWVPSLMALQKGRSGDADVLKAFPRLEALVGRFLALPKIAEYYQNRS